MSPDVRPCAGLRLWTGRLLTVACLLTVATAADAQDACAATGVMAGEKFVANHCAVALLGDQHSVTLWFSETPLSPPEIDAFQVSAYASSSKDGKERTMLLVAFCPGAGKEVASAGSVKQIDLGLSHAKSAMAGAQWLVDSPKDFKIERLSGALKPGSRLAGRITGSRTSDGRPYSWDLTFDVTLPATDAASGVTCGS